MHLWTEYVGNTLEGYPLDRLSRSEGRSAFFATTADGQPALLRLTEAHFDDGELIGRWQKIAKVKNPGLQAIWSSGQTVFDGVSLAYCVLEPSDASLSEVLRERVLEADEAVEVADAVAGALAALHAAGLVHGHVDAINVFAVGEAVKLRSDCARECMGDFEADTPDAREALRQRDVHDLGMLLRRCLTPQWQESTAMQLPSPFDRIVRRALNGSVSAAGIAEEMQALRPAPVVPMAAPVAPVAAAVAPVAAVAAAGVSGVSGNAVGPQASRETVAGRASGTPLYRPRAGSLHRAEDGAATGLNSPGAVSARLAGRADVGVAPMPGTAAAERIAAERTTPAERAHAVAMAARESAGPGSSSQEVRLNRVRNRLRENTGTVSADGFLQALGPVAAMVSKHKAWVAAGVTAAVLAFVVWSSSSGAHPAAAAHVVATNGAVGAVATEAGGVAAPAASAAPAGSVRGDLRSSGEHTGVAAGDHGRWHVIAYTYRHEKEAEAKVKHLRERHAALQPQVYSPSGHSPFFVALGGGSDSGTAIALRNRARRDGLPRDTFARNF